MVVLSKFLVVPLRSQLVVECSVDIWVFVIGLGQIPLFSL